MRLDAVSAAFADIGMMGAAADALGAGERRALTSRNAFARWKCD